MILYAHVCEQCQRQQFRQAQMYPNVSSQPNTQLVSTIHGPACGVIISVAVDLQQIMIPPPGLLQ